MSTAVCLWLNYTAIYLSIYLCSLKSFPGHHSVWMQFNVMPRKCDRSEIFQLCSISIWSQVVQHPNNPSCLNSTPFWSVSQLFHYGFLHESRPAVMSLSILYTQAYNYRTYTLPAISFCTCIFCPLLVDYLTSFMFISTVPPNSERQCSRIPRTADTAVRCSAARG